MLLVFDAAAQVGLRLAAMPRGVGRGANQLRRSVSGRRAAARPRRRAPRTAPPPTAPRRRCGSCRRRSATPARPPRRWRSRRPCARPSDTNRRCDRRAPGTPRASAISPSPTAVVKLSTRKSSIVTLPVAGLAAHDDLGARGERDRRPVAGRIVVAQAADHRAHLAHDRVGDHARHVVDQAPAAVGDPRRALDVDVPRDRADRQHLSLDAAGSSGRSAS